MKPIIKKQSYYSMLLMRDDTSVRTLRIKGSTIKAFLIFLFLLILGGGGGIWGGMHYWKKYAALSERHALQDQELKEARLQLERWGNYETLLAASNGTMPLAKNEEIGASAPRAQNATQAVVPAVQNATSPAVGNATRVVPASVNATTPQQNATSAATSQPRKVLPRISSAASPLRINGFIGRVTGPQRLRIRYELATAPSDEQKTVSGMAKYFAAFANGTQVELPVPEIGDSRFAISRMKPMDTSVRLPQGHYAREVSQINVAIELDDGQTYWDAYPITR